MSHIPIRTLKLFCQAAIVGGLIVSAAELSAPKSTQMLAQSQPTNQILAVIGRTLANSTSRPNVYLAPDEEAVVYFFTTREDPHLSGTNDLLIEMPCEPEFLAEIEATDHRGAAVPRTRLGKKWGSKFSSLSGRRPRMQVYAAVTTNFSSVGLPGGLILPPPSALLKLETPGTYTLSLRFQGFVRPVTAQTGRWELVRTLPLQVKVANP